MQIYPDTNEGKKKVNRHMENASKFSPGNTEKARLGPPKAPLMMGY